MKASQIIHRCVAVLLLAGACPAGAQPIITALIKDMLPIPGKNYKMGKYEVTQAQWEAVMGTNPAKFKGANKPIENITRTECHEFLEKLNALPEVKASGLLFRLPTAKEWEYACRARTTENYCRLADGRDITKETYDEVAWNQWNSRGETHPVGEKTPNAFGLYDIFGNVWERTIFEGPRPLRAYGGSWNSGAGGSGYAFNETTTPSLRSEQIGFRLCADCPAALAADKPVERLIKDMVPIPGKNYQMGKYEVTQAQWEAVMGTNPSAFKGADNPVENVSWNDCQEFLEKLNALPEVKASGLLFRLPTAKEWEYACRAGSKGAYCRLADGKEIDDDTLDEVAWCASYQTHHPRPVGEKTPNAFDLYDMIGNVSEWTQTKGRYKGRVTAGGYWNGSHYEHEASTRTAEKPSERRDNIGFRLCASKGQ